MKHIIVGTAGHVDHGKTALIEALTGFSGDSLDEEKRRGITIDLSFSHMKNSDTNVAFIDVPGHEKLLKNMVAGAFGFDACMVVVDANEGLMPQTIEHLDILNLLHVENIIVVLTKSDLADADTISKRRREIDEHIKNLSNLRIYDLCETSIYSEQSIKKLKDILFSLPSVQRDSDGPFRYYVDRSFSLSGIGQVVTGTILEGEIKVGDKIFAPETKSEYKIKNLQVHDEDVIKASISQRTAINIQGNSKRPLKKGTLLCKKGFMKGFNSVDVWFKSTNGHEIRHGTTSQVFIGTKQVEAKILLLETELSSEEGFATLHFKEKIFLMHNELFILSNAGRIIGGGRVLNPIKDPLKKRVKLDLLNALKNDDFKSAFSLLCSVHKKGFGLISSNQRFGLSHKDAIALAKTLKSVFVDNKELVIYPIKIKNDLENMIRQIYEKNEYALLSPNSLSIKLKWASTGLLQSVLDKLCEENFLVYENGIYKNASVEIKNIDTHVEENIYQILKKSSFTPDAPYNIYDSLDIDRKIGDSALKKLTKSQKVVRLTHNLFVEAKALSQITIRMREIASNNGYIDISNFRKYYNFSRKYLVAYLDYLDNFSDIKKEDNRRYII